VGRRRGFQHERVAEVEPALRRPLRVAIVAAVVAVLVGLPGLQPFNIGSKRVAGLTFLRFVHYGSHPQAIGFNGVAFIIALLALVCGVGGAVLVSRATRRTAIATPAALGWASRVAAQDFYVEWLLAWATRPILAIASRVSSFDVQVTAPIADSVGESVDLAATGLSRIRDARLTRYLAGSLVVIAILTLLSILAATGHFWVHTA